MSRAAPRTSCGLRRLGPPRGDAGVSLVELLVTVVIAGIVLPLITGVMITAQRRTADTVSTASAVADARLALQDIDRQVRSGAAPLSVSGQAFGFWTAFAADGTTAAAPRCVQYSVVGGALKTRSFVATASAPAWSTARTVATGLTASTSFALEGTTSVSVDLRLVQGSGRPARVDSTLTTRNTTTASTAGCATLT